MSNPFDQFDSAPPNPFDRFDGTSPPPAGATGEAPKDEAQPGFFSQAASRLGEGMTSEGAALGATAIMHDMAPAASAAVIAHHFANQAAPVDAGRKAYETEGEAARHQLGEDWKSGDYLGAAADVGSVLGTYIRHPKQTALGAIEGLPGMVPMLGGMEGGAAAGSAAGAAATAPFAALSGPAAPVVEAAGTGLGAVAGAFGGGTAAQVPFSYGQWVLQRMAEEGKKRGLDLTKPEDVAALAADPTFNKPVKAEASRFGLTDSAAQTAVAMMGGKLLGLGTRLAMPVVTDAAGKALLDSAGKVVTKPLTKSGIAKIATAGAGDIALQAAGFGVGGEEARAQATGEGFSPERAAIGAASSLGPALVFTAHGAIKGAHGEQAPKGAASQSGEEKPAAAPPSGFTAAQDDDGSWGVKGPDGAWVDSQRFSDPHAAQAAADIHAEGKQGQTVPLLPAPAPQRALPAPDTGLWGGREPGTGFNMKEAPPEGAIPVQGENGQGFILGQTPAAPPVHPDLAQMIAGKAPGDEVSFGDTKRATGLKAKADITQARQDAVDAGLLTLNGDGKTVVAPRHPAPGTEAAPGFDPATGNVAVRADNGQGAVIKDEPNAEAAEADAAALNGGTPAPRRRPLGGNDQWEGFGQPDFTGWGDHPAPGRRLPEASPPVPPPEEGAPPPEPQARTPGEPAAVPMPEPAAPLPAVPPVPGHEAALPLAASAPNAAPAQAGQVAEAPSPAAPAPVPPPAEPPPSSTPPSLEAAMARYHAAIAALQDTDEGTPAHRQAVAEFQEAESAYQAAQAQAEAGKRHAPVDIKTESDLEAASQPVDTEPSPAQIEAGNYAKGHGKIGADDQGRGGIPVTIENPKGSVRRGTSPDGTPWEVELPAAYGYFKGTEGADGDHVDTFIGPNPASPVAYAVDQVDPATGAFDENKILTGFDSPEQAVAAYDAAFSDGSGPSRRAEVTAMTIPELKGWLKDGDTKAPIAPQFAPRRALEQAVSAMAPGSAFNVQTAVQALSAAGLKVAPKTIKAELERLAGSGALERAGKSYRVPGTAPAREPATKTSAPPPGAAEGATGETPGPETFPVEMDKQIGSRAGTPKSVLAMNGGEPGIVAGSYLGTGHLVLNRDVVPAWDRVIRASNPKTLPADRVNHLLDQADAAHARPIRWLFGHRVPAKEGRGAAVDEVIGRLPNGRLVAIDARILDFLRKQGIEVRAAAEKGPWALLKDGAEIGIVSPRNLDSAPGQRAAVEALAALVSAKTEKEPTTAEPASKTEPPKEPAADTAQKAITPLEFRQQVIRRMATDKALVNAARNDNGNFPVEYEHAYGRAVTETLSALGADAPGVAAAHDYNLRNRPGPEAVEEMRQRLMGKGEENAPAKPMLQDVGERMEGKRADIAANLKAAATGDVDRDLDTVIDSATKANIWKIALSEAASSGTRTYLGMLRDKFPGFVEHQGGQMGGGRRRWQDSFSEAIRRAVKKDPGRLDEVREAAAKYVALLQEIEDATRGATTVEEARAALSRLFYGKERPEARSGFKHAFFTFKDLTPAGRLASGYVGGFSRIERMVAPDGMARYVDDSATRTRAKPMVRPGLEDITRTVAKDWRQGKDVTGEHLMRDFGFRGVEFGNWVNSAERQANVNHAFEALHDLAETLGIPPQAISLGGKLGLAFGSRGKGSASAHYEPGNNVINLTRTRGDGTVAHEWGHALDKALQDASPEAKEAIKRLKLSLEMRYRPEGALSTLDRLLSGGSHISGKKRLGPLETARQYVDRLYRLKGWGAQEETQFKKEADALGKDYWGNENEPFARAFEAMVFDRLEGDSPYLVSDWVDDGHVTKAAGYRGTPYPQGEERRTFNAAIQDLIDHLAFDSTGTPSLKSGYVDPIEAQLRAVKADLDAVDLERRQQDLKDGNPSLMGLWWYRLPDSLTRDSMPGGYFAYDENARDWRGKGTTVGYRTPLPASEVDRLGLQRIHKGPSESVVDMMTRPRAEEPPAPPARPEHQPAVDSPDAKASALVRDALAEGRGLTLDDLQKIGEQAYGGTLASGAVSRDRLYDAVELGVNRYIKDHPDRFNPGHDTSLAQAKAQAEELARIKDSLPTQSVRAGEKETHQQFSTPPDYAYAAAWAADLHPEDRVLEPSAGTGSLAVHALNAGVERVFGNEISAKRAEMLRQLGLDRVTGENAEHLHNVLPDEIRPTAVVMNPPFSATAGRMGDKKVLETGAIHVEQALRRLEPGGRLVAIVGRGMAPESPAFRSWWKRIGSEYDVRANVGVDGGIYRKYGTSFGTRLLVIDKAPPSGRVPVTGEVKTAGDLMEALDDVRRDRPPVPRIADEPVGPQPVGQAVAQPGEGGGGPERPLPGTTGVVGMGEGPADAAAAGAEPAPAVVGGGDAGTPPGQREGQSGNGRGLGAGQSQPGSGGAGRQPGSGPAGGGQPAERGAGGAGSDLRPDGGGSALAEATAATATGRVPSAQVISAEQAVTDPAAHALSEAVYEAYRPQRVTVAGAKAHPGALVQSAAMASVAPPTPKHQLAVPKSLIESGALSDAQLESVVYAGHAHSQMLPSSKPGDPERRRGFFIGDGTGVGKGREVAGIILDNWAAGRTKAVWISEKKPLINDARRDWVGLGQDAKHVFDIGATKAADTIKAEKGIAFTTYDTLKSAEQIGKGESRTKGKTRVQQIVDWLGKDFDGVIAFDEAHNLGNSQDEKGNRGVKKAAAKALAGVDLQRELPNARVVYVSATGATEVQNLAYADRLGLWGKGTAFADRADFLSKVSSGGIAAMELVARDMKALGMYVARNLSYDGVEYDRVEHRLSADQRAVYDELAKAWQVVLKNFHAAMDLTGVTEEGKTRNGRAKSAILSAFWGGHQRFFNQIITSMQMPSVLKAVEADIKGKRQAVLQLVNTNEAAQDRALEKAHSSEDMEDLDLTPRDQLMQLVERAFPVTQFEEYTDDNGNVRSRPVQDAAGNPVLNKQAVAQRDRLLDTLGAIRVPEGPLEILLNHFGTDQVAEVTGRKQRVVRKPDEQGRLRAQVEKRPGSSNVSEANLFQQGKKPILVFSEAGGTGRSYHAENGSGSEDRRRSHYLVQAGWRADKAVQGFGRTHRTNQASAPLFHLVTTDLDGQKRFISSIARRLAQLGALTKGERRTGDQGLFGLRDNLESEEAKMALSQFFDGVMRGTDPDVTPADLEAGMGLKMRDENGNTVRDKPEMTTFLNRLLSLTVDRQNAVFRSFSRHLDDTIERAAASGSLDTGTETYRADRITKKSDQVVYSDPATGAETRHVHLEVGNRTNPVDFDSVQARKPDFFVQSVRSGKVFAVRTASDFTDAEGRVFPQYRLSGPVDYQYLDRRKIDGRGAENYWRKVADPVEARRLWEDQVSKIPEMTTSDLHLITGAVLPIWDRLGGSPKIYRLQTDAGERMLGRVIPAESINATLEALGAEKVKVDASPAELVDKVMQGYVARLANGWRIERRMVAGEPRLEIKGVDWRFGEQIKNDGAFSERINYETRYFIPTGPDAAKVIERITAGRPVVELNKGAEPEAQFSAAPTGWENVEGGADNLPSREEAIAAITRAWDEMGLPRENGLLADRLFGEGESLTNSGAESAGRKSIAGVALGRVAALSLEAMDPTSTAYHEGFHILEHAGAVRPDEIALMERENEKLRRLVAAHVPGIDAEALTPKEVRAYGFEAYRKAKAEGKPVGMLPRLIREAYDRVALFFSRLGNALRGMGFRTSEDVYRAITEEKRGQRVAAAPEEAQALMDRLNSGEGSFGANYSAGPVDQLPPVITRQSEAHSEARDEVLWRGAEDGNEHNAFVDTNGKTRFETSGEQDFSAFSPETVDRLNDAAESITIHHNHPGGGGLSMTDIVNLAYPGVRAIVAHTHSGESSAAWLTAEGRNLLGRLPAGTVDGYLTKIYQDAWDAAEKVIGRREGGRNTDVREIVNRALDSVGLIHYESGHALDVPKGTADLARNASITAARNTLAGFERRNPRAVEILDQPSAVDRPEAAGGFHRQDEDAGPGRRRREGRDLGSRTRVGASGEASSFPSLEEARDRGRAFQEGTDGLEHRLADLSISLESADGRAVVENGPKGTSGTDDTERAAFAQRLRDFADEVTRSLPEERRRAFSKALVEQYRLDALKATSDKAGLNRLEAPERALAERWMAMAKEAGRHRMTMPDLRAPRRVPPPPAAPPSVETINRHLDDVLKALSPTSRGLLAKATERIFRKNLAERAQKDAMVEDRFQQFRRLVNGLDEEQRWRFLDNIEEGRPQDTPELRQVDAVYRRLEEHFRSQIQSLGTGHLDHFLENYVRHYWQDPRQAEAVEAQMQKQAALAHGRRPLEGSKAWQRQRTIRTYREGMEKGLKPLYSDPLTIMVNQFADLNKFYHAQLLKRQLVESGLVRFERSLRVPAGERAIDDKMFRAMTPITNEIGQRVGGMEIHGQWVAPEPVARLVNNYLSAGLHGRSAIYDSLREAGNTLNMVQLGLSAFHATFASIDTMISRMALGLMQASRGEFGEAGKNVLGAFNPLTVKRSFDRGKALEAAYLHPGTVRGVEAEVARMFVEGGGRKSMDHFWNASATHDFFQSWKNGSLFRDVLETLRGDRDLTYQGAGDIPKLAANIPWTVLTGAARLAACTAQTVSHPLMQALVPRLKMGVFADLTEDYLRSHPNASDVERADFAIKAWDSVENRLGQMTYDNLFWHRVQKDLAFIMIRSVGWNLGTIRELGGGVLDTVRALRDLKAGKPSEMTTRMAYAMAMPLVVGTLGAMMNYAFTGQAPQDWRDYFFPRTGRPIGGEAGNAPERLIIPSYIKDVLEYSSAPLQTLLNKQNPLVSSATELYQNKDYYGGAIYNQDDPAAKRLMEIGEWAFGQYAPFSARGMAHLAGTHTPAGIEALSFFGFQPAPAAIADPERVALIKWQENHRDWQRRQSREAAEAFREKGAEAAVQVLREAGRSQRSIKATMRNLQSPQRRRQQLERAYRRAHPGEDQ